MAPKGKTPTKPRSASNAPNATVPPAWPALKPLLPRSSLSLSPLIPDQIVLIHNLFTSTLCKSYISFLKTLPLTTTPGKPKRGDAVRVNDRFQIDDPAFAERLWMETGLRDLVSGSVEEKGQEEFEGDMPMGPEERRKLWGGDVVGLNPSIRIYRYTKGQFFDQHYDESNIVSIPANPHPTAARTTWTLLLYLTSAATGCQGGETVFYPDDIPGEKERQAPIIVELETGMALLHKHGKDCMLHEGREVTEGEKWVMRSDLCVRR